MQPSALENTDLHEFRIREEAKVRRLLLAFSVTILCIPGVTVLIEEILHVINPHQRVMTTHALAVILCSIAAAGTSLILYRKFDFLIRRLLQAMTEQQHAETLLKNTTNEIQHSEQIAIALLGPRDMSRILKIVADGLVSFMGLSAALVARYSPEKMTVTALEESFSAELAPRIKHFPQNLPDDSWTSVLRNSEIARRVFRAETVISDDHEDSLAAYLVHGNRDAIKTMMYCPIQIGDRVAGFVAGGISRDSFSPEQQASIARTVHLAAVAMHKAELFQSVCEQERDLRVLCARLEEVEEKERKLLAGVLHDQIGPNITALGINLSFIKNRLKGENVEVVEPRIVDSLKLLEELADRTRSIIANVHPPGLSDRGLQAALRELGDQFSQRSEIRVEFHLAEPQSRVSQECERILYRIALEGLNNIARHAKATKAEIHLGYDFGCLRLTISDNGKGVPAPEGVLSHDKPTWGLRSMRERAESIGGHFRLESTPGLGTQIHVEVPVS